MATTTLYCTGAKRWNWQDSEWDNFNGSYSGYSGLGAMGQLPEVSGWTAGIQMYTFQNVPAGAVISAATLKFKIVRFNGTFDVGIRLRVSSTYEAYTTSAPSGYQSTTQSVTTTLTEKSLDITSQVQSYATAGSALYLYMYAPSVASGDLPAQNDTQYSSEATPYIEITYTIPADTVGRYNGSTWENCEVYRYNGSAWVACEIYRYNGSTWVQMSTT